MREIKFRAWDTKQRKMFYNVESMYEDDPTGMFGKTNSPRFLCFGECLDEVKKGIIELMQYTELKDKNGKEIYEGDIIKTGAGDIAVVEHFIGKNICSIISGFNINFKIIQCTDQGSIHESTWKIVGNIYQNPELIK